MYGYYLVYFFISTETTILKYKICVSLKSITSLLGRYFKRDSLHFCSESCIVLFLENGAVRLKIIKLMIGDGRRDLITKLA